MYAAFVAFAITVDVMFHLCVVLGLFTLLSTSSLCLVISIFMPRVFLIVTLIASGVLLFYCLASFMFYRLLPYLHIHLFDSTCLYTAKF